MASVETGSDAVRPIRSILKKSSTETTLTAGGRPARKKKSGKTITFDANITMKWAEEDREGEEEEEAGGVASSSILSAEEEASPECLSMSAEETEDGGVQVCTEGICGVDQGGTKEEKSQSGRKSGIMTTMSSVLSRRGGRKEKGGEVGAAVAKASDDSSLPRRRKKKYAISGFAATDDNGGRPTQRRYSDISALAPSKRPALRRLQQRKPGEFSASAEYPPTSVTEGASSSSSSYSSRLMSLPRGGSLDSAAAADIFTRSNKSLRSRIAKFGRYLRPDFLSRESGSSDDALMPVLTKVTPLDGTPLGGTPLGGCLVLSR